jgi:peptidoglycan/LPS O-acetylase OafA/YrhL
MHSTSYRADIDGLRAIAVLSVVAFHAFGLHLPGGFVGVDVFFVISGYLITGVICERAEVGAFSFLDFYGRRVRRIFPALLMVLAAVGIVGWLRLMPDEFEALGRQIFGGAAFVANFVLWLQSGYFDVQADQKPLLHLWSLGVEEQFYLIWPILICLVDRKKLIIFMIILFILSFFANIFFVNSHESEVFYFPITRFWELIVGGIVSRHEDIAAYLSRFRSISSVGGTKVALSREISSTLGFAFLAFAILRLNNAMPFPGWWALLPTLGSALLIAAGPKGWVNRLVLAQRPMTFIGLISYPLYLWHWPILAFMRIERSGEPPPIHKAVAMLAAILLAWITYRIEIPIRSFRRPRQQGVAVVSLVCGTSLVGLFGLIVALSGGIPSRLPATAMGFATYHPAGHPFRDGECFLEEHQDASVFSASCVDAGAGPLVLLWGDSHASHLYLGLKSLQNSYSFRIAQFTASACPPLLDTDFRARPLCRSINTEVSHKIEELKPDIVVLAAQWIDGAYDVQRLKETASFLRKSGVNKVVLVGPVPYWRGALPRILVQKIEMDSTYKVPLYLDSSYRYMYDDTLLEKLADELGFVYISPMESLCRKDNCLALIGDQPDDMMSFDASHLSPKASQLLLARVGPEILGTKISAKAP